MRLLVFGRGKVVRERYLPSLEQCLEGSALVRELEVTFVRSRENVDAQERQRDLERQIGQVRLESIDKILVLSPPQTHLDNLLSVVRFYAAAGSELPEIYIEKPLYLRGEREAWEGLLAEWPCLQERAFYIDHYRYKEPVLFLERERAPLLARLGPLRELAWVSLEAQPFWDSPTFAEGYLLEHGCHFVSVLRQVFEEPTAVRGGPTQPRVRFIPARLDEWRAWVQRRRPASCNADSAVLMHLIGAPGSLLAGVAVTVAMAKGMYDQKFLKLQGDCGSCTIWFNEGRFVLLTAEGKEEWQMPAPDSYGAVVRDILGQGEGPGRLLSLREGMWEQEAVIELGAHLPKREGESTCYAYYEPGEVPPELARELARLGAWM